MKKQHWLKEKLPAGLAFICILGLMGCAPCNSEYTCNTPENMDDGFRTGTLSQVHMDTTVIAEVIRKIKCGSFNEIHSMLIYKDDMLVLEEFFMGHRYQWDAPDYYGEYLLWTEKMLHPVMSCTKSYASAFIGIAIDKGYIKGVNECIFNYLPDHQQYRNGGKENITIEHLLTMTSGLAWDEWGAAHGTSANDVDRLYFECSDDPLKCVLERELVHKPGESFTYNGGGVVILGEILKNATGMDVGEFSKKYLFEPLGVDSACWYQFNNGVFATDGSLYITPRDMLKFGVTYLNGGRWNGQEILPESWVSKSAEIYINNMGINIPIEDSGENGYGYLWWVSQLDFKGSKTKMYRANGWGGQVIMVFPDLGMVVAFTSGNYASESKLFKVIKNYVLPSVA